MARVSRNASIPYRPYSRPTPEYLKPPQGACGSSVMPLITTRLDRICDAPRRARWRSVPRTAAWRPYFESLAIRIASSSESYAMTQSTGPKISSWAIAMSFVALTKHRWFHEVPALESRRVPLATGEDFGALLNALADVRLHPFVLLLRHHRPNGGLRIGWA